LCRCAARCVKWRWWRSEALAWLHIDPTELDLEPAPPLCALLRFSSSASFPS
jgi:hypothetical protein